MFRFSGATSLRKDYNTLKKIFIFICLILIFLTSCAGVSDWSYKLPNGYQVWRINSGEIIIKHVGDETVDAEIPSFIKEFSYDDRYVFTRNIDDVSENNIFKETYYVLDTVEQKVYGPFESIEIMKNQAEEWQCEIPTKWYRTSPDPNMGR